MAIDGKALLGYWFTGGSTIAERAALTVTYGLSTIVKERQFYPDIELKVFPSWQISAFKVVRSQDSFVVRSGGGGT